MDRYQIYLKNEYLRAGIPGICCCQLGGTDVIVPVYYRGNINKFKSDLFDTDRLKNASRDKIIKGALRRYKSTIQKAIRIKNEYKHGSFYIRMSTDFIRKLDTLHQKYLLKRLTDDMQSILKWTTKQTLSVTIGSLGALPAATYWLLDKKVHFADNTKHKFIKEKLLPSIRKGALKTIILASLAKGADFSIKQVFGDKDIDKIETPATNIANVAEKEYKITDQESFDKMYQEVLPLAVLTLMPTEIFVSTPYSDNGKAKNTIGLGSFYYPKDGNPMSSIWMLTKEYLKKHPELKKISGQQAYLLVDGWFRYREKGRIYKEMFKHLKGATITGGEFAATMSCTYNNEALGIQLCDFIRENHEDPYKCAAFLVSLKPSNKKFEAGITKRHSYEALVYLNPDNFVDKIGCLSIKRWENGCYGTSLSCLNPNVCSKLEEYIKSKNDNGIKQIISEITNHYLKGGCLVDDIIAQNNMPIYIQGNSVEYEESAQKKLAKRRKELYNKGIEAYKQAKYSEALDYFKAVHETGAESPDIHNDLAITYYHLGDYNNCIAECREVIKSGETEYYPSAYFNAGMAYLELGNAKKAKENFDIGKKFCPKEKEKSYKNAIKSVMSQKVLAKNQPGKSR